MCNQRDMTNNLCSHAHTIRLWKFFFSLNSSLHNSLFLSFFFPKFDSFFSFSFIHSICFNVNSENFPFCIVRWLYHVRFVILLTLKTIIQRYRMFLSDNFYRAFIKWHEIPLSSCNTRHTFYIIFIIIIIIIFRCVCVLFHEWMKWLWTESYGFKWITLWVFQI